MTVPVLRRPGRASRLLRAAAPGLLALGLLTCAEDPIGPPTGTGLSLVPVFGPYARVAPLVLNRARILIERFDARNETSEVLVDDTVAFSVDRSQLRVERQIRMTEQTLDVFVTVQLLSGTTLLFGGSQSVTLVRGGSTGDVSVPMTYSGIGNNLTSLVLGPRDTTLSPGAIVDFRLDAFDVQGAEVPQYYVSWSLAGSPAQGAAVNAAGRLTAPNIPDTFYVKVAAPNGVLDSTLVMVGGGTVPTTTFIWTGAVSTDWSTAGNWNPAQVPGFLDSAVIGAAINQPSLTTATLVGAISIITGGNLTIAGQGLSVARGFSTGGDGVLTMTNEGDVVGIGGDAVFDGGNELGLMSEGGLSIVGNLTQRATNSGDSFHPSGNHLTVFSGANPTLSFATPGLVPGTSHFQQVGWIGTGTLTLATPVLAHGEFIIASQGNSIIASSNGSRLTAGDLVTSGPMAFNNVPLTLQQTTQGTLSLNDITFSNMPTNVSQVVISHPGGSWTFNNLVFSTTPVGPNGFYLDVTDVTGPTDGGLIIDMVNPTPATPGNFVRVTGGAVVNWPSGTSPVRTWTGAVSTDWSAPGNWSPAQVPDNTSDVVIPVTANSPSLTSACAIHTLQVNVLATLNLGAFNCVVGGNVLASGTITGTTGAIQIPVAAQIAGRFPDLQLGGATVATGTLVLSGSLTVSGATADLILNGNRMNITGNLNTQNGGVLTMANPLDTIDLLGNANFAGGSTTGKLTAGALSIGRGFTQSGTPTSFAASGNHRVNFPGNLTRTISFSDPLSSQFQTLDLGANLANFNLASNVRVLGQLISKPTGIQPPIVSTPGAAGSVSLTAGGADITLLTMDKVPLILSGGTIGAFNNVLFQNELATGTQLTVNNVGQPAQFTFANLSFLTAPTGGGLYLAANDVDGSTPDRLVINLSNPGPVTSTLFNATNGAVVTWGAALKNWIGPAGGDWFTAANWSPAGVPTATDNVVLPAATSASVGACPQGATTRDLTLQISSQINGSCTLTINGNTSNDNVIAGTTVILAGTGTVNGSFTGPVTVSGTQTLSQQMIVQNTLTISGGSLTLSGHGLIPNDLDVGGAGGTGRLIMTNVNDTVVVVNGATFRGSDENGFLTAGQMFLNGNFTQATGSSPSSFAPTGTHRVIVQAPGTITLANPGPSFFRNLQLRATTTLNNSVTVTGTLITNGADNPTVQGTGSLLVTGNLGVIAGMVLTGVPLTFTPVVPPNPVFDNVRFTGFGSTATQFTINGAGTFTFNSLRFDNTPTTGFYLSANGPVTVNLAGPTPATGGGFVQQLNGATVIWPAASTITWAGTINDNWSLAGNWSPAFVPSITTDVVIPAGRPFNPQTNGPASAKTLSISAGASLNVTGGSMTLAGNVFADGPVTGGTVFITAPAQIRGTLPTVVVQGVALIVTGRTVLSGDLGVNSSTGSLALNGQTLQVGARLVISGGAGFNMVNPLDSVIVNGEAQFLGSSTVGKLTAGVLVVRGNFTQSAIISTTSFAPSGTHKTVLGSAATSDVSMGSPGAGAAGSHFQILDVSPATGGIILDVNMQADSLISTVPTATIQSPLVALTARRVQVTGLTFFNTRFILDEQGAFAPENFSNVTFTGYPGNSTGLTLFTLSGPGGTVAARPTITTVNVNFLGLAVGAGNFYVDATSTNSGFITLTMTGSNQSPQAVPPGNGPALTNVTPPTGIVTVNWP